MEIVFARLSNYSKGKHPENIRPPLDIGYSISIAENRNHETHFIDMKAEQYSSKKVFSQIKEINPDIVLFKCQTPAVDSALWISDKLRDSLGEIIIGMFGQHATIMPETFLYSRSPVDFCIRGEPEKTIERIIEKGEERKGGIFNLNGITYFNSGKIKHNPKRKVIENLDKLPMPKHQLFLNEKYRDFLPLPHKGRKSYGYILSSRGCPYKCIYCSPTLRVTYGREFRRRKASEIVDEMEFLVKKKNANIIVFKDDVFTLKRDHVINICKEILNRDLEVKWFAQTRADYLDYDLLKIMKRAGCKTLGIGIESGSPRILKLLKKGEGIDEIRNGIKMIKSVGINVVGFFMLGNPTETELEMKQTMEFCKELKLDMIQVAFFTPYPGSPIYEKTLKDKKTPMKDFSHYNKITHNYSQVSDEKLEEIQKKFYLNCLLSFSFIVNYIKKKIISLPYNIKDEIDFIKNGMRFLMGEK